MDRRRLVQEQGVRGHALADELLLHRSGDPQVVHLDAVGTRVWALLASPRTREELVGALAAEHAADPERVRTDLAPLLDALLAAGLLALPEA